MSAAARIGESSEFIAVRADRPGQVHFLGRRFQGIKQYQHGNRADAPENIFEQFSRGALAIRIAQKIHLLQTGKTGAHHIRFLDFLPVPGSRYLLRFRTVFLVFPRNCRFVPVIGAGIRIAGGLLPRNRRFVRIVSILGRRRGGNDGFLFFVSGSRTLLLNVQTDFHFFPKTKHIAVVHFSSASQRTALENCAVRTQVFRKNPFRCHIKFQMFSGNIRFSKMNVRGMGTSSDVFSRRQFPFLCFFVIDVYEISDHVISPEDRSARK